MGLHQKLAPQLTEKKMVSKVNKVEVSFDKIDCVRVANIDSDVDWKGYRGPRDIYDLYAGHSRFDGKDTEPCQICGRPVDISCESSRDRWAIVTVQGCSDIAAHLDDCTEENEKKVELTGCHFLGTCCKNKLKKALGSEWKNYINIWKADK